MPEPKGPRLGRPTLPEDQQAIVLGSLLMLTKRTPEYRQARRELAVRFQRTERAIEILFEQLKARHQGKLA